jgi:hypothetical protein
VRPENSNTRLGKRLQAKNGRNINKKRRLGTAPFSFHVAYSLVTIVVVIVVVPIALIVPAVSVFIPPAMRMFPAPGAGVSEFVAPMIGLRALPAVVFHGIVKLVIRVDDALLAIVIRAEWRSNSEHARCGQGETYQCANGPCF